MNEPTLTLPPPGRGFPTAALARLHCECGKCIGEVDVYAPHVERIWCARCKTWTVVVIREKGAPHAPE